MNGGEQFIGDIPTLKHLLTEITTEDGKRELAVDISIEKSGNHSMGRFHRDTIFITKTGIPRTTTLAIWNFSILQTIAPYIAKIIQQNKSGFYDIMQSLLDQKPELGTSRKKGRRGIKNMERTSENSLTESCDVKNVVRNIKQEKAAEPGFVRITVNQDHEELYSLTMSFAAVKDVIENTIEINTEKVSSVPSRVVGSIIGNKNVYNLTVQNHHEYYANGILVANCLDSLRYAIYTHMFAKDTKGMSPLEYDRMRNEALGLQAEIPEVFRDPREYGDHRVPFF